MKYIVAVQLSCGTIVTLDFDKMPNKTELTNMVIQKTENENILYRFVGITKLTDEEYKTLKEVE